MVKGILKIGDKFKHVSGNPGQIILEPVEIKVEHSARAKMIVCYFTRHNKNVLVSRKELENFENLERGL